MIELILFPFLGCLVLAGIHAWLGMHIIDRGVIFVDLALAQLAALGSAVVLLVKPDAANGISYLASLLFTLVGAVLFSLTRHRRLKISQEALIGLIYVFSMALTLLVLDRVPSEVSHVRHLMVGNILFMSGWDVLKIAILYSLIGLFHFKFRRPFQLISQHPEKAFATGLPVRWYDFLFYASFGVVVTSSVNVAGVLLVFSYLMAPAFCASLFSSRYSVRLLIGWGISILASIAGMTLSVLADMPTGLTIILMFAVASAATGAIYAIYSKERKTLGDGSSL